MYLCARTWYSDCIQRVYHSHALYMLYTFQNTLIWAQYVSSAKYSLYSAKLVDHNGGTLCHTGEFFIGV